MSAGDILNIGALLKKAYDLIKAYHSAHTELQILASHITNTTNILQSVQKGLVSNPRSILYQKGDSAQTRKQLVKSLLKGCQLSLSRFEAFMKKFNVAKEKISKGDKFTLIFESKAEIADMKIDLLMSTTNLHMFLTSEGLVAMPDIIAATEHLKVQGANIENYLKSGGAVKLSTHPKKKTKGRGRSDPDIRFPVLAPLVLVRFLARLKRYRRKKQQGGKKQQQKKPQKNAVPGQRPKVMRQNSGFGVRKNAPKTPYKTRIVAPAKPRSPTRKDSMALGEHKARYECWKVGVANTLGLKGQPKFIQHKRRQAELENMAATFNEASGYDKKGLNKNDERVKLILKKKNAKETEKHSGRTWHLEGARVIARVQASKNGVGSFMVVEKALVIVVRR